MSLYSIHKLIDETRRLAAEFKRTTGTTLPVSGEIARYDVSHYLDLTPSNDPACGYDAIGNNSRAGMRVQIKSRIIDDAVKSGHRLGQLTANGNWDLVILSLMDNNFEPYAMYQLSHHKLRQLIANNNKTNSTISVAKFKKIGELVWTSASNQGYSSSNEVIKQYAP